MHNDVSGTIYSESKTEPDNNHVSQSYFILHIFFSLKPKEAKLDPYNWKDDCLKKLCGSIYTNYKHFAKRFEENIIMWTSCTEGIKATFWEYHLTFNFIPALDLFETLLMFEIATEEQI